MIRITIVLIFMLFTLLSAKDNFGNIIVDEVTSIYDGDTFRVNISSYPAIAGSRVPVRINAIDAPELRGKCKKEKELARKAKQFTVTALRNAKKIELKNMQRGKYFRIVADVYVDNYNLADKLIHDNLAVAYDGGTKMKDWCK